MMKIVALCLAVMVLPLLIMLLLFIREALSVNNLFGAIYLILASLIMFIIIAVIERAFSNYYRSSWRY